ncbi:MAG: hypothetical protein JWM43_3532 [Acidobacteriaceae bacterium]|nr:hypothetical protein [Acidobacteriaceae bacterium]
MKAKILCLILAVASIAAVGFEAKLSAQSGLKVIYGGKGIQQVSYNGVILEDLNQYPSDAFHIWHMKVTDLSGNILTSGQYGWGENANSRTWDGNSNTWNYSYTWGSIAVHFVQHGDSLDMTVTAINNPSSGIIFDGAVIYPFVLNFPSLPLGFTDPTYAQLAFNTTGPSVTLADFGSGEVAAVFGDAAKPLYSGFQPANSRNSYFPIISGTALDGMASFQPHNDRPVLPGQTDTYTVSLRFAPSGAPSSNLAGDAYSNWASTWPPKINWTDRRPIGTVYLASSPTGNVNLPGGFPNNPRRYFNDSNANDFDIRTRAGLSAFQSKIIQQALANVTNLQSMHAQGAITWDMEGQQYPQATSYVCSPDQIAQVAPEMESLVTESSSPYVGMKLDDTYFKIMRDAGFRVGVCIRPQHFALNADGSAQQVYLANAAVATELIRKMKYAHDRWGCTLFYVDSTVESNGAVLDASIFQQVAAALPDSLISPEESTPKYYAYTAPFRTFIFHGDLGTDPAIYNYYSKAFSIVLINDVAPDTLMAARSKLAASVRGGDILMGHVDYWQANNPTLLQIYQDAGISIGTSSPSDPAPPSTPPPPTDPIVTVPNPPSPPNTTGVVVISAPMNGQTIAGQVTVTGQVYATLDAAGSYLMVDGIQIGTGRVSSAPYIYPLDTSTLANGSHTLQLWAHDTGNNAVLSSTVAVTVSNTVGDTTPSTPTTPFPPTTPSLPIPSSYPIALNYPLNGQTMSGLIAVAVTILQNLDAAGSYLMVDGLEIGTRRLTSPPFLYELDTTTLTIGTHLLQIWAHDINNNTLLSNQAAITVAN